MTHHTGIDPFAKPHHAGPDKAVTVRTLRRNLEERDRFIPPSCRRRAAIVPTKNFPDRSVKPDDFLRAGSFVQAIDVLGDQLEMWMTLAPRSQHFVRAIWFCGRDELAPPVVPFPDKFRITSKCVRRAERLRPECFPKSIRSAKGGNATCGRNACAGQDGDADIRMES